MKSIQKPLNGFLEALHTCFAKTDSLLHGMIDRHTTKIKEIDIVLHEARRAYDHIKRLSSRPMISSKSIMSLIDVLEKNLEQIDTDILQEDECPENDVPLKNIRESLVHLKGFATTAKTAPLRIALCHRGLPQIEGHTDRERPKSAHSRPPAQAPSVRFIHYRRKNSKLSVGQHHRREDDADRGPR
jgi:hypothetical protein